jgi:DNA polymerase-1
LGEILFDKMGLEGGKKGKTGKYSTPADVLEDLATLHDLPGRVLDWRQLSKLKSTYTDALQDHINAETGRVHTSYSIAGANTGRLASTDPNLQNIPVRTEEGRRIREAFVAEPGKVLVSLDYSQIELRILAHIAGIDALKQAFKEGQDIHAATASRCSTCRLEEMTPDVRRQAKAINFGVIYGIRASALRGTCASRGPRRRASSTGISNVPRHPGLHGRHEGVCEIERIRGRRCSGARSTRPRSTPRGRVPGFAARAAINAPIQGTAADVIRRAMIRMEAAIEGLPAVMLLQVHDELLFEVDEGSVDTLIDRRARGDGGRRAPGGAPVRAAGGGCGAGGELGGGALMPTIATLGRPPHPRAVAQSAQGRGCRQLGQPQPESARQDVVLVVALYRRRGLQGLHRGARGAARDRPGDLRSASALRQSWPPAGGRGPH